MTTIEIKHRFTGAVIWAGEAANILEAVNGARAAGADLRGANLGGADLRGANLGDADLRGANLGDADLRGANLGDANLGDADLRGANLGGANLGDAHLGDADLRGANLRCADLRGANLGDAHLRAADLRGADLRGADLRDANLGDANLGDADLGDANLGDADLGDADLRGANLGSREERMRDYRQRHPKVPVVEHLDAKILAAVESGAGAIDMSRWHSCETTHCRAGWAVHLAGEKGYALERERDAESAGRAIYLASTGRCPYFFDTTERALEDIKQCAAEDAGAPACGTNNRKEP